RGAATAPGHDPVAVPAAHFTGVSRREGASCTGRVPRLVASRRTSAKPTPRGSYVVPVSRRFGARGWFSSGPARRRRQPRRLPRRLGVVAGRERIVSADRSRVTARQPGRNWASVKAAPRTTGDHQSVKATPRTGDHLTVKADPPAGDWSTVTANPGG